MPMDLMNPLHENNSKMSPLKFAKEAGGNELVELLESYH